MSLLVTTCSPTCHRGVLWSWHSADPSAATMTQPLFGYLPDAQVALCTHVLLATHCAHAHLIVASQAVRKLSEPNS
jgi:hypothetical protein